MKINENKLAAAVTRSEGGAVNLPIGQVKEVIRLVLDELAGEYAMSEVVDLIERHALAR